jgi:flagellar FliJ protein
MKKFRFTLEKLLSYKESMLDKEKITLAALRAQLGKVLDKISFLTEEREAFYRLIREDTEKGTTAGELRTKQYQIENIGHQLQSLNAERARLEKMVENQLNVVIELTKEKTELEMLRDKQLEAFRLEEAKENELIISEFVSGGVIRRSRA